MSTMKTLVPAGTTSAPMPVTPMMSCFAACAALGGTYLLEFSQDGRTTWMPVTFGAAAVGAGCSFRPPVNGYVRVTANTVNAVLFFTDFVGVASGIGIPLASIAGPVATFSSTTVQPLFALRVPPRVFQRDWAMTIDLGLTLTNNANVKTLHMRVNGIAGSALVTSPSLASQATTNLQYSILGRDGLNLIGSSIGTTGGIGNSTTALSAAVAWDFLNNETELMLSITKATAGDTAVLDWLRWVLI